MTAANMAAGGVTLLPPSRKLLFRQIRSGENYSKNGVLTSLAFKPASKDNGELSVDVEPHTTAQKSFEDFKACGYDSIGVWAVTTEECASVGLDSYHSPKVSPPPNPSHGHIDFTKLKNDKEYRAKAILLAEFAMARKCQHPQAPAGATVAATQPQDPPPAAPAP